MVNSASKYFLHRVLRTLTNSIRVLVYETYQITAVNALDHKSEMAS